MPTPFEPTTHPAVATRSPEDYHHVTTRTSQAGSGGRAPLPSAVPSKEVDVVDRDGLPVIQPGFHGPVMPAPKAPLPSRGATLRHCARTINQGAAGVGHADTMKPPPSEAAKHTAFLATDAYLSQVDLALALGEYREAVAHMRRALAAANEGGVAKRFDFDSLHSRVWAAAISPEALDELRREGARYSPEHFESPPRFTQP